jgi:hypothetical protein
MISVDFSPELIIKAYEILSKNVHCEVKPDVRLTSYNNNISDTVQLVCKHEDGHLNIGASGADCDRCANKEKAYESSKEFSKELKKRFENLVPWGFY